MDVLMVEEPLLSMLNQLLSGPDKMGKPLNVPARSYVRDNKAMASTPVDVKEYRHAGLKSGEINVQIKEGNVFSISGERKSEEQQQQQKEKEKEKEEAEVYLRMERRVGKFMRKFNLPRMPTPFQPSTRTAWLTVMVQKVPPPEPKKPKIYRGEGSLRNRAYPNM